MSLFSFALYFLLVGSPPAAKVISVAACSANSDIALGWAFPVSFLNLLYHPSALLLVLGVQLPQPFEILVSSTNSSASASIVVNAVSIVITTDDGVDVTVDIDGPGY